MSEHYRKEKNCLNCGHIVEEHYCTRCGQKNIEVHENAWSALWHFVSHYFHADGKFLSSIIPLISKPGHLTNEFNIGRRARYIHPFQFYIFISVVYFFFYLSSIDQKLENQTGKINDALASNKDEVEIDGVKITLGDTSDLDSIKWFDRSYLISKSVKEYKDSIASLPDDKKPGFFLNLLLLKTAEGKENGFGNFLKDWVGKSVHNIPKMMFFLLPFLALLLKMLYVRRKIFYVQHLVFILHFHSLVFLFWIVEAIVLKLVDFTYLKPIFILYFLVYFVLAMKFVYRQSWFKTLIKSALFIVLYLLTFILVFAGTFFISAMMV